MLPRPACGERAGVRGYLTTAQQSEVAAGLPLTRKLRCAPLPTSPRKRSEVNRPRPQPSHQSAVR
jgi:hypothetical protein